MSDACRDAEVWISDCVTLTDSRRFASLTSVCLSYFRALSSFTAVYVRGVCLSYFRALFPLTAVYVPPAPLSHVVSRLLSPRSEAFSRFFILPRDISGTGASMIHVVRGVYLDWT